MVQKNYLDSIRKAGFKARTKLRNMLWLESVFILPMVGSMTIITTFITPYMVKIGWKIADALDISDNNRSNNNKKT